jgi:hypothetical protein
MSISESIMGLIKDFLQDAVDLPERAEAEAHAKYADCMNRSAAKLGYLEGHAKSSKRSAELILEIIEMKEESDKVAA